MSKSYRKGLLLTKIAAGRRAGEEGMMNLTRYFFESFQKNAHRPALVCDGKTFLYGEMKEEIRRRVLRLQRNGIQKGDRVALLLPKGVEFIFLHLAALSLGAVSLPLNPAYSRREIDYCLGDSESRLVVTDAAGYEKVREAPAAGKARSLLIDDSSPRGDEPGNRAMGKMGMGQGPLCPIQPDDTAIMIYTSGTTGQPKGAMITHRNLVANMLALQRIWRWTEGDILLHVLPIFHIHGLIISLQGALHAGSKVILHEKFDPRKTWETLERERCTLFTAVPTIYHRLLREWPGRQPRLSRMRLFISGAAPLSEDLFHCFEEATGFRILDRYGMTEAGVIASNPLNCRRRIAPSVGYPLPGVRVRIADRDGNEARPGEVGEIWIRGENVFKGYWRMPAKTEEAFAGGWFKTGDLGYQDPQDGGRLFLVARAKELIITGGYNVYPKEVEQVLERHEAIREAAVVGWPDAEFGEKVTAMIVLEKNQLAPTFQEIRAFCKKYLAGYKCPREVHVVEELPRNAMGKIQKGALAVPPQMTCPPPPELAGPGPASW